MHRRLKVGQSITVNLFGVSAVAEMGWFPATVVSVEPGTVVVKLLTPVNEQDTYTIHSPHRIKELQPLQQ